DDRAGRSHSTAFWGDSKLTLGAAHPSQYETPPRTQSSLLRPAAAGYSGRLHPIQHPPSRKPAARPRPRARLRLRRRLRNHRCSCPPPVRLGLLRRRQGHSRPYRSPALPCCPRSVPLHPQPNVQRRHRPHPRGGVALPEHRSGQVRTSGPHPLPLVRGPLRGACPRVTVRGVVSGLPARRSPLGLHDSAVSRERRSLDYSRWEQRLRFTPVWIQLPFGRGCRSFIARSSTSLHWVLTLSTFSSSRRVRGTW